LIEATASGLSTAGVRGVAGLSSGAPRPRYSALRSERGGLMPMLDDALRRVVEALHARP